MKKIFAFFLTLLGMNTACSQQAFENQNMKSFNELIRNGNTQLVDVRTAEEFFEGHLPGALNIDMKKSDFMEQARRQLTKDKTVAVYCRSGRRSATAAEWLAKEGYRVVNLKEGIQSVLEALSPDNASTVEVDEFRTKSGKTVRFHALVHASIRMEYDGKEIQIDPVGKLGQRITNYAAMPKADLILVTHEHGDHFDKEALGTLTGENTLLVTNQRCAEMYGKGEVMKNGDKRDWRDDFSIEAVPAYNYTEGRTQFHPKGRDNGFILTVDGLRIYIAGDTEDIPEMKDIKDIDIAFLPCNQPYTMTTEQLVKAARIVKPKVLFPYHYGQTDVSGLPAELKSEGIDVRIRHYE